MTSFQQSPDLCNKRKRVINPDILHIADQITLPHDIIRICHLRGQRRGRGDLNIAFEKDDFRSFPQIFTGGVKDLIDLPGTAAHPGKDIRDDLFGRLDRRGIDLDQDQVRVRFIKL